MDSQATSDVTLTHIWQELRVIRALLEKKNPNPPLDGWLDPSDRSPTPKTTHPANEEVVRSSALVDLCKRLEHCYRSPGKRVFIDYKATQALVDSIFMEYGLNYLTNYIRFCEERWRQEGGYAIGRPERMHEQYQAFASQYDFNQEQS